MDRSDVTFPSGNDECSAWLYLPDVATDPAAASPIIVLGHGVAGVKEQRLDAFAERFAAEGYPCLVFDYRHFGQSSGEPRQLLDIPAQRQDWRSAISYARSLPGIDPDRIVLWGSSFGGGHVIDTASREDNIAAVVAQCPFTDGLASSRQLSPLTSAKLSVLAIRDLLGSKAGKQPIMVPAYGTPSDVALMTTPDSLPGILALNKPGHQAPLDIAARFVLQISRAFPGRRAKHVSCPILFVICTQDSVAPAGPTRRYARQAPHSEVVLADAGHFDIYVGDDFETNIAEQIDFLTRHVPLSAPISTDDVGGVHSVVRKRSFLLHLG